MNPLPVRETTRRVPSTRNQNVAGDITPPAIKSFSYFGYAFAAGVRGRWLSLWGYPWWLTDRESAPVSGGFSMGFSSGFEGGVDSPQGSGFSTGFSSGFGQ